MALLCAAPGGDAGIAQAIVGPSRQYLPLVRSDSIPPIVFVSRQILAGGSIYWDVPKDMPGVGPHSRFRPAAPGRLLIRERDGSLRALIDGSRPTAASLNLIDVNAPDVSYDGSTIVFAGLPKGSYPGGPGAHPGAWRIYTIGVNGGGLRQVTRSDQALDMSQFGQAGPSLSDYDDGDPAWLPDGRIVFSSTRWPSYAQYSGVRTSNLYVVRPDGSALRRITSERNGADRPLIDPITGKIVYARWWRNHRFPANSMATIVDPAGGYIQKDGLTTERTALSPRAEVMFRNAWQIATINPDGTDLAMWAGSFRDEEANHSYGGSFTASGELVANFFPMFNMTEASGFGGLRRYRRGPGRATPVIGVTGLTQDYVHPSDPTSFGIFNGSYAGEPDVLPDNRVIFSLAGDVGQDYGLYMMPLSGGAPLRLYDNPGTAELRARAVVARPLPPIIADQVSQAPSLLPPTAAGPYTKDGTFTFEDLNIYANGPVDSDIVNAPPVGSASSIRFFLDHQRTSPGSFPSLDWPIALAELAVSPAGSLLNPAAPANLPLFEQLRRADGSVPQTTSPAGEAASAHVAGMNFGRPGEQMRCVGCHAGHSMLPVPASPAEAQWANLAPGAQVRVSSTRDPQQNGGLVDRRVMKGEIYRYWTSAPDQVSGQWVQLTFPVPISVRAVRLYNPRPGGEANASIQVQGATVVLYSDAGATSEVGRKSVGALSVFGSSLAFSDVRVRSLRVFIGGVSGTFYGMRVASLAEVEVIGRGEAP